MSQEVSRCGMQLIVILEPLEYGKFCAHDSYVIMVINCCTINACVENSNVTIVRKCSNTE